ncbi:MAG: hypothetical protein JNM99_22190 [Verrucomicrobiaceae bacterium]|nr:hypothetical protein [Verrucomicrobiaceae bacterium]
MSTRFNSWPLIVLSCVALCQCGKPAPAPPEIKAVATPPPPPPEVKLGEAPRLPLEPPAK